MLYLQHINRKSIFNNEYLSYLLLCFKRYIVETTMVFIFQYSGIFFISSSIQYPPFNAPLGLAFSIMYIRGHRAILGVVLAMFCSYIISGHEIIYSFYTTISYITISYIMTKVAHKFFRSDVLPFASLKTLCSFIVLSGIGCLPLFLIRYFIGNIEISTAYFKYISEINGILLFGGYLLTMAYIPYLGSMFSEMRSLLVQAFIHLLLFASLILNYHRVEFIYITVLYISFICLSFKRTSIVVFSTSMSMFATIIQAYYFVNYKIVEYPLILLLLFSYLVCALLMMGYKSKAQLESMLS